MDKLKGYFYKSVGTVIDYTLRALIAFFTILVNLFSSLKQIFGLFFSAAGCFILLLIFNPLVLYVLVRSPIFWIAMLSLIVPIIGNIAVSYLKYIHYMATEYFYDKADYYILGRTASYKRMQDYGRKYIDDLERERLKREEERRKRQEEEFRNNFGGQWQTFSFDSFEEFFEQAQRAQGQNYGSYQGSYNSGQGTGQNVYQNSFKDQYEAACDVLGVPYTADKYEIKLNYRKLAKLYHPDLNKEENAAEKFKEVNNAYEFLSDENIARYKRVN